MNKVHKREQSLFLMYILLSLLFHAILLLVLFISFYAPDLPLALKEKLAEQAPMFSNNQNDVAELKSGPGTFGAPITFDHLPDVQSDGHQESTANQQQTFFDEATDNDTDTAQEETNETRKVDIQDEVTVLQSQSIAPLAIAEQRKPSTQRKKGKRKGKKRLTAGTQQQQKGNPLTFAKLMQGFLDSLDEGGKEFISRKGNPNKRPDNNELKYISYTQKIAWYLQQAWKIDPPIITTFPTQDKTLFITMTIDKEGALIGLNVNQYSGVPEFDTKIVSGIRKAGPFPPLPDHFNSQTHTISFGIILQGNPFATQQTHQKTQNAVTPRARIVK